MEYLGKNMGATEAEINSQAQLGFFTLCSLIGALVDDKILVSFEVQLSPVYLGHGN